jgi:hypothetical protein
MITVVNAEQYTSCLTGAGQRQAWFDGACSGGSEQNAEGNLALGPLSSPRRGCPPGSLDPA